MGPLEASLPSTGHMWSQGPWGGPAGLTPGPGRHPGGAVRPLVLPDVLLLVVVEGLDAVTAAGLKQSCAGLRARAGAATRAPGEAQRGERLAGRARVPRSSPAPRYCPAGTASPAPPRVRSRALTLSSSASMLKLISAILSKGALRRQGRASAPGCPGPGDSRSHPWGTPAAAAPPRGAQPSPWV